MTRDLRPAFAGLCLLAGACAGTVAAVQKFEARAAPAVATACADFRKAEADPLVQVGLALGTAAANAATSGVAGPAVAAIKSFGDQFCAAGPPPGDTTSAATQAGWLAGVTAQLLGAAAAAGGK